MTDVDHTGWTSMLHAYVDGELDSLHVAEFEKHLENCPDCRSDLENVQSVRAMLMAAAPRWKAPPALRRRIFTALQNEPLPMSLAETGWQRILRIAGQWSLVPSLTALAASLFLFLGAPTTSENFESQLVENHVRSLLADHLADVMTSNRHTVKPWFAGKIDFSPPVMDLVNDGFPLVGGRVDYLEGKVVAALVYRRGGHIINLFVRPGDHHIEHAASHEGYNIREWSAEGLNYSAVSDVEAHELAAFEQKFTQAARLLDRKADTAQ